MLTVLLIVAGLFVICAAIVSPFLALLYQKHRDSLFEKLAKQHGLQFTKNSVRTYQTLFSNPPRAARTIEGSLGDKNILIGDYVGSIFSWGNNLNFLSGWTQTKIFVNTQEQQLKLSPFWSLASEEKIRAFLTR